jgi:uncharacterized peroxidase-related enzyme
MVGMSILATAPVDDVTGLAAELYVEDLDHLGYVPSHTRLMAINPEAVRGFETLIGAIRAAMSGRRYELITLAAAEAIGSQSCRIAHAKMALRYMPEDEVARVVSNFRTAGLSEAEVGMMEFAGKVSRESSAMTDADSQRLRDLGFQDREIVDIALAAAARNYFSRALHALAADVDVPPDLSPRLREALAV